MAIEHDKNKTYFDQKYNDFLQNMAFSSSFI